MEALKKQVSALQYSPGRAGNSRDDRTIGGGGTEITARRDRSLSHGIKTNGSKRRAPSTATETSARPSVDDPCNYMGCYQPSHIHAPTADTRSRTRRGGLRWLSLMDDGAHSGPFHLVVVVNERGL